MIALDGGHPLLVALDTSATTKATDSKCLPTSATPTNSCIATDLAFQWERQDHVAETKQGMTSPALLLSCRLDMPVTRPPPGRLPFPSFFFGGGFLPEFSFFASAVIKLCQLQKHCALNTQR